MNDRLAVQLNDVNVEIGNTKILHSITFSLRLGEQVAIIGPSGAGKTTLIRTLCTAVRTENIRLYGDDPWRLSPQERKNLRAQIGVIWQKAPLPASQRVLTAVQAGRLGRWSLLQALKNLWRSTHAEEVQRILAELRIEDKLMMRCGELSGGQLQRVGAARVLFQAPKLLLADEPVSALDPMLADLVIQRIVSHCKQSQSTCVASLHAVDLALNYFPRVIGLREGRILFDAAPETIDKSLLHSLYAGDAQASLS